jgi:hypothetical protein
VAALVNRVPRQSTKQNLGHETHYADGEFALFSSVTVAAFCVGTACNDVVG